MLLYFAAEFQPIKCKLLGALTTRFQETASDNKMSESVADGTSPVSASVTLEEARDGLHKAITYLQVTSILSEEYVQALLVVFHYLSEVDTTEAEPKETNNKDGQVNEEHAEPM